MKNQLLSRINTFFRKPDTVPSVSTGSAVSHIEAYNQTREPALRKSLCYAPSVNMLFAQDGSVKACCHNQDFSIGNYPQQTIREIWNSQAADELRAYMAKFDFSHGCNVCEDNLNLGSYYELAAKHFDTIPVSKEYPRMMEFLLTNTCNLECVMCKGEFSSSIRKNRENLPPIVSSYDKQFVEQLKEFIPHLLETRFSGSGEAFSIDMNYEIWEHIIALNPKCIIMVQSNGTYLNARIKDVLSRGNFQIGISLDSLHKETFEAIRLNANFDRVMENIQYFSEYCKQKKERFSVSTCVMRQNWHELPDFMNFVNSIGALVTFHKVSFPIEHSLRNLPYHELKKIVEQLSGFDFPQQTTYEKWNRRHYFHMVAIIKNWMEERKELDAEKSIVAGLKSEELLSHLHKKVTAYLETQYHTEKGRMEAEQKFTAKFNQLLQLFPDKSLHPLILRQVCSQPIEAVIQSVGKNSIEFLFTQLNLLLNNKN